MKLKEKLAEEWNQNRMERFICVSTNQSAWINGFETAKQMCIDKLKVDHVFFMDGNVLKSPSKLLTHLGEEEVDSA